MDIFISHSSLEASLANGLKEWLEWNVPNISAFSASVPDDLPPGSDWFREIVEQARRADHCLILLSPDSLDKHWLYFEAGLNFGAADAHKLIPVLYGGLGSNVLPGPFRQPQILNINDRDSFNAFVNRTLAPGTTSDQWYDQFCNNLSQPVVRLIKYGLYGGYWGDCEVQSTGYLELPVDKEKIPAFSYRRFSSDRNRHMIALRVIVVPRREEALEHWKFGVQLRHSSVQGSAGRVFEFHSGAHGGRTSWTIYDGPGEINAFNFPGRLEREAEHRLEIWLSSDQLFVTCVGVDSRGHRAIFPNEQGENRWRLMNRQWDEILVKVWGDGHVARVDIKELEIHWAKL